jgi:hypothetical protein
LVEDLLQEMDGPVRFAARLRVAGALGQFRDSGGSKKPCREQGKR